MSWSWAVFCSDSLQVSEDGHPQSPAPNKVPHFLHSTTQHLFLQIPFAHLTAACRSCSKLSCQGLAIVAAAPKKTKLSLASRRSCFRLFTSHACDRQKRLFSCSLPTEACVFRFRSRTSAEACRRQRTSARRSKKEGPRWRARLTSRRRAHSTYEGFPIFQDRTKQIGRSMAAPGLGRGHNQHCCAAPTM